jgi:glucose/arabinose dehydrogenase
MKGGDPPAHFFPPSAGRFVKLPAPGRPTVAVRPERFLLLPVRGPGTFEQMPKTAPSRTDGFPVSVACLALLRMQYRTLMAAGAGGAAASLSILCSPTISQQLASELVVAGMDNPLTVTSPPGDGARLFVVEQLTGRIRIIENGELLVQPFLDVGALAGQEFEQGLLGMAFHPDYWTNGRFFVHYTDLAGNNQVVEYHVSANPDVADPTPVQTIFTQIQPYPNHNGGHLAFGADGMLYIGLGDGGDQQDPGNRAQNGSTDLGKMLRFDVDLPPPFIPPDNPFVDDPLVNDEIWALGFRNPWRYSFDRLTGDLYIGDVGQDAWEEIDFQAVGSGGGENYGWRCIEANLCTGLTGCECTDSTLAPPIWSYPHWSADSAVIGGYVYRGSAMSWFQGSYLFGDYSSGRIWSFRYTGGEVTEYTNRSFELDPPGDLAIEHISSFGEDGVGELYVIDRMGGEIYRIVGGCQGDSYCESELNSSGSNAVIGYSGSTSLAANNMVLHASQCPPRQPGIFFYGPAQIDAPFGNGHLCVGSGGKGLFQLRPPQHLSATGRTSRPLDFTAPPMVSGDGQITIGSTWNFQFWFRDPAGGGAGFNLTDAISVQFCP